jgi:serine protease
VVSASNGEYHWALNDLPAGRYRIVAGSDMDDDGFLCDAGESCGAYRTLDAAETIDVEPAVTPEISGIDFVSEFRAVITTRATAETDALRSEIQGYRLVRPAAPARPAPGSAAEQR